MKHTMTPTTTVADTTKPRTTTATTETIPAVLSPPAGSWGCSVAGGTVVDPEGGSGSWFVGSGMVVDPEDGGWS